jgi:hypothetical protein
LKKKPGKINKEWRNTSNTYMPSGADIKGRRRKGSTTPHFLPIQRIANRLVKGEKVMFVARQSRFKPGGSKSTPATFFVTSQRLIVRDPSMMGMKEDFSSVNYDKISSVNVKKGFFSSTLKIMAEGFAGDIHAIDKRKAEKIMSYIQEKMA